MLEIYDEYYPKLYGYILARTKSKERTEDIVQQTFVKAMQSIGSFKKKRGATIGSWLFTIAKNTMIDDIKKSSRVNLVETSDLERLAPPVDDALQELIAEEEKGDESENLSQMWKVIETLSNEEREVIQLKYIADLSYKDISVLTGVKPNTLAQTLRRALKKCKKVL